MADIPVEELIRRAATDRGVDPAVALRIAERESSLNPTAKNRRSSAYGLFQITDDTWKQYGGTKENRASTLDNIRIGMDIIADNERTFAKRFGRAPSAGELYSMHFLGRTGGPKVLGADPNAPVASVVSPKVIKANPELRDQTVGEFIASMQKKMGAVGDTALARRPVKEQGPGTVPMPQAPKETMRGPKERLQPLAQDMVNQLGPNYQAALAAMALADTREDDEDDENSLSRQYRDQIAAQETEDIFSTPQRIAGLELGAQSPFPEEEQPVMMANGGEAISGLYQAPLEPTFGQRMGAAASDLIAKGLINAADIADVPGAFDKSRMSAAAKIYLDTFGTKENRAPITKDYFSPAEMQAITQLIEKKGGTKGSITYDDYKQWDKTSPERATSKSQLIAGVLPPRRSVSKALGQFNYELDPKTKQYRIIDEYDFNPKIYQTPAGPVSSASDLMGDYVANDPFDVYTQARLYGGRKMPPGTGRKVDLSVPASQKKPVKKARGGEMFADPMGMADSGPITADTRRALTTRQGLSAAEMMRMLQGVGREGVSNLESLARGSVSAVPGVVGDIESIFRDDKNRRFATSKEVERQYLPQRLTKPTKESEGFVELGTYIDPTVAKPVAKVAAKAGKALGPTAADMLQGMAPAAQPMYIVRPSGGVFPMAKSVKEEPVSKFDRELQDTVKWMDLDRNVTPERAASLNFLDTKVRNYFKTQAGSVSDPVREALIAGRIKIPKDSKLEETFPQALVDAARSGDVTAMRQLENTFDDALNIRSITVSPEASFRDSDKASEAFTQTILEQMKNNPQIIPDAFLLRLSTKNADKLAPAKAQEKVAQIREKLASNPTLFNTVFEEKLLRLIKEDPVRAISPQQMEDYPSMYGQLKNVLQRQEGIMALSQNVPITDVSGSPRILGQSFRDIGEYAQMIPPRELERMDVPEAINRVIQLKKANEGAKPLAKKAASLLSSGKVVPEKITTYGTKVAIPADDSGYVWREITDPSATLIQAELLNNSIGGYSRPGTYGKLEKGASALASGEVKLFSLYDKNNQVVTNVEYITDKATGEKGRMISNTITQFYGNGPRTGNITPEKFVPQVQNLISYLDPRDIPPSIKDLFLKEGVTFERRAR